MSVKIVEVAPRDGLQNISQIVPTNTKVELIERLAAAGLKTIEATSFVSPRWVPQLADAKQVLQRIQPRTRSNVCLPVLVPNVQGLELAHRSAVDEVAVFVSATEGFSKKNINCTVDESLIRVKKVIEAAKPLGIRVRGYVSCIFCDPYDGPTTPQQVRKVTQFLLDAGCYEVSLGDTLGVGTPTDVQTLYGDLLKFVPKERLAGHFHDTYGQAIANVVKSYDMGIRTFDSSIAGLGGCPFAKGAKGNLATEDLVYTLNKMGVSTGVNLDKLVTTGTWISGQLGLPNGSRAGAALASQTQVQISKTPSSVNSPPRKWEPVESTAEFSVQRSRADVKITLTRPRNGNALTKGMLQGLTRIVEQLSKDSTVFRILFSAQGKYYCSGMDLRTPIQPEEQFELLRRLFEAIDQCPQTTIALINGPCFGGGVGLAFVCDLRIASSTAAFKLSEVRLGLCPAVISKYVIREWGLSLARAAMLTAREVSASELLGVQAVQKVVDSRSLDAAEAEILDQLRFSAPRVSALCKELVNAAWIDPGGERQAKTIRSAFDRMMANGSESQIGLEQFRKGVKGVDWATLGEELVRSKL